MQLTALRLKELRLTGLQLTGLQLTGLLLTGLAANGAAARRAASVPVRSDLNALDLRGRHEFTPGLTRQNIQALHHVAQTLQAVGGGRLQVLFCGD